MRAREDVAAPSDFTVCNSLSCVVLNALYVPRQLPRKASASQQRCPADCQWLLARLQEHDVRAYKPTISVNDPKQRRAVNEVTDWCSGEALKLWHVRSRRCVPGVRPVVDSGMRGCF